MDQLADTVTPMLDLPALNKTGLSGAFQVSLDLSMANMLAIAQKAGAVPAGVSLPPQLGAGQGNAADPGGDVTAALEANPELALKLKEIDSKDFEIEQTNVSERWKADMNSDSWLSKNIRPMVLIFLLVAYSGFAIASIFEYETRGAYVELLGQWGMLVMSFYFGGRTMEKIADKVKK